MLVPNRTSTAYKLEDLEVFETHERKEKRPQMQMRANTGSRRGGALKILFLTILAVTIPIYFLSSKAESSVLSVMISEVEIELSEARSENARLQAELDSIVTTARVQEFAENELGFQKISTAQSVRIFIGTGGKTEVAERNESAAAYIAEWFKDRFSDAMEFLGVK